MPLVSGYDGRLVQLGRAAPRVSRTLRTWSVLMPNARLHRAIDQPARVYRVTSASWSISRLGPPVPIGFFPASSLLISLVRLAAGRALPPGPHGQGRAFQSG
jgi:hypothetical protein